MNKLHLAATAAMLAVTSAAGAETVSNTSLQNVNGQFGTSTAATTTTATGTRTTVTGPGPNAGANRASGVPVTNTWFQANVGAGSTVGITTDYARSGNGSAYFNSVQGDTGKGDLIYYFGSGAVALSSLSSVAFDFYRDSASTTNANLAPVLRFDMLKNGSFAGSLVFENVYQQQATAPVDSWTTLAGNLNSGIWWATNGALGPTSASGNGGQKTLAQWIADNGSANLSVYGLEIGIGSGWNNSFYGGVDNVNVNFTGGPAVASSFEVAATGAVPEPASWAMMILGVGGIGLVLRRRKGAAAAAIAA